MTATEPRVRNPRRPALSPILRKYLETAAKATASSPQLRARQQLRENRHRQAARKRDTRQKIILGGTVVLAILDDHPLSRDLPALLRKYATSAEADLAIEDALSPSTPDAGRRTEADQPPRWLRDGHDDEVPVTAEDLDVLAAYRATRALEKQEIQRAELETGSEGRPIRKRDTRRKIIIGGLVLAGWRADDPLSRLLPLLLNRRVRSPRDRATIADLLPVDAAPTD